MFEEELLEKTAVCTEILQDARNELYLNMRFLDVALNSLSLQPTFEVSDYAVDGAYWSIYVNGEYGNYSADQQPVADGDVYGLVYTVYEE